jgi:hypothetical protein
MKSRLKSLVTLFLVLFLSMIIITGCGAKKSETSVSPEAAVQSQSAADSTGFGSNAQKPEEGKKEVIANSSDRKIIKSASMELEALEFDKTTNAIITKIQSMGGYVESSNIQGRRIADKGQIENRTASITFRVPKQSFDAFILEVGNLGNVISKNTSGQDVTGEYFDTEAHLKSLMIQEERLLEILKKTGQLKDIIELEKELANVRYQIENLTGTLKKWDNLIDYSTVRLDIREVQEVQLGKEKPKTLWDQISHGFSESIELLIKTCKQLLILLASILPFVIVILAIYIIGRRFLKLNLGFLRRNKNNDQK